MVENGAAQSAVRALLARQIEEGRQIGAQVCAYKDGTRVVDLWGGQMGPEDDRPVQADSLFLSFSVTKGPAALALHQLADQGLIDYDAPVATYWPAFAANGKERLTVAQAMSHQGGIHATPDTLTDWDAGIKYIEEAVPVYEPGTSTGYHAVNYAWIVGGIVQGASGRRIKDFIAEDIAAPLGLSDEMYVGIPDGLEDRLTTIEIWDGGVNLGLPPDADFFKAMPTWVWSPFNAMEYRKACLPSINGHFTARALAKMYAALAGDGSIDGVRLVSPERIPSMQRLMTRERDIVLGSPTPKGIGFWLGGAVGGVHGPMGPRESAFGHPGAGGAIAFADPEARLSVAVTLNKMAYAIPGQAVEDEICNLIRAELGVE